MFLHIVIGSCRSGCRFMIVTCFVMTVAAARYMLFCGGRSEKQENGYANFACHYSSLPMVWSLVTLSGQTTHLGTCYNKNNCTSPLAPDIEASLNRDYSDLSIRNIRRETAGTLQCSDGKETANCTLDVQSYAKVDGCTIQVHTANWSAVGSCGVTNVYSALERYVYDVFENDLPIFRLIRAAALTPYVNTTDGKDYFRGNYTHTWPLRHLDGTYTYKMIVYPSYLHSLNFLGRFVIERPVPPSLQCEMSSRESVGVPCVCSTPSVGRPAGRLLWLSRDTVLAAGQYGVTELHLYATVDESGQPLTCQLDWIIKNNVSICIPAAAGRETILYIPLNVPGADSALMLGVAVGGYVALGVVLAVVVVVGVVLWRRGMLRRKVLTSDIRRRPSYDTATRERQLTEEEDGYTCLDMREVASEVQRTGAAKADSDPEEIYENTTIGRPI